MTTKTIDLSGETLHYADFGGQGPAIVLVHGLGGSHPNWLAVGPALARRGRVVALDLPGFGRSARSSKGTSLEVLGTALARFMDAMSSDPVHLVGNSMGGTLTVLERQARPERVASALLVCPALPPPPRGSVDPKWAKTLLTACVPWGPVLLRRHAAQVGPERVIQDLIALCCVDPARVPAEVVAAHVALTVERAPIPWIEQAFAQAARSLMVHLLFGSKLRSALRASGPPTLIVHGQKDRLVDVRSSRQAVAANPRIELIEWPDLGHTPQLEAPDVFLEGASRWLDRTATRASGANAHPRAATNGHSSTTG